MSDVLDVDRMLGVIQRRCESHNVSLTFDPYAKTASTNGSRIIIPTVTHPVTPEAMAMLHGFVIHECGHHSRPDAFKILKSLPKSTPEELFALFNIMEDDGMEREVANKYAGDAIALGKSNSVIIKQLVEEMKDIKYPEEVTEEQIASLAVTGLGQLSRLEWDGMSNAGRRAFFEDQHEVTRKLTDELAGEGWVRKMQDTENPHDCWDLAVDIYKRLYPDADEEETEKTRAQGHSGEPPPPEEGDGETQACGEGEKEGEGATKGEGQGAPKEAEGSVVSWKDVVFSEHNEWAPKEEGELAGSIGIDWTDYQKGTVALMPPEMVNVIDLKEKQYKVEARNDWNRIGTPESFMSDNKGAATFGNQIRRYIQARARTRVVKGKLHGKIDKGALFRLAMPAIDGGEWNKKIFYDHTDKPELDTCIMVLTDWSGSMQGNKMVQAADASGRLVQVFDRILRIPVQLAAFSDARSPCDIGLIKSFNDKISPQEVANRFSKFYKLSSANNDADAVMWAYRQIARRKEKRKILIVLSDGCPAGSWAGSSHSNLSYVTNSIEQRGDVDLYGVGIMSSAVETYYKNCKVLADPNEINNVLMDVIKQGVK